MTSHGRWRTDPRLIASAVVVAAVGYALAMVAVEVLATNPYVRSGSLLELSADLLCLGGRLGPLTSDKPDSCLRWYDTHPVTGALVFGHVLADWPALRDVALRGHRLFRDRVVIGGDLALTDDGPLVLEGNSNMDVSFIQCAYRYPIGRSRLGELLGYRLSALRRR